MPHLPQSPNVSGNYAAMSQTVVTIMTTTKIITNTIYFAGLLTAIVFDLNNFQFYFVVTFIAIQIVFIVAAYIVHNRTLAHQTLLIEKTSPSTLKDLLLLIPLIIVLFGGFNLLFKFFDTKYLVTIISIAILSAYIQYLVVKGKMTATLLIDRNILIVNDLFLKRYNLETLNSIDFDGFDKVYTAEFATSKNIKIQQDDYRQDDLNKFIATMTTKSNLDVVLSENIKKEITTANNGFCTSAA